MDSKETNYDLLISKLKEQDPLVLKELFDSLKSFTKDELKSFIPDSNNHFIQDLLNIIKNTRNSYLGSKILNFLKDNSEVIPIIDRNAIARWVNSIDYGFLIALTRYGFIKSLDKEGAELILKNDLIKRKLLKGLENRKVSLCTSVKVTEITENSVKAEGKTQMEFPADTVVIATGSRPVNALKDKFSNAGFEVKVIGDANKVGLVMDATTEGFNVGRAI